MPPAVKVLNALQELREANSGFRLGVGPPLQDSIQQLPSSQQLRDQVHLLVTAFTLLSGRPPCSWGATTWWSTNAT
jgi:hypothetical protein